MCEVGKIYKTHIETWLEGSTLLLSREVNAINLSVEEILYFS